MSTEQSLMMTVHDEILDGGAALLQALLHPEMLRELWGCHRASGNRRLFRFLCLAEVALAERDGVDLVQLQHHVRSGRSSSKARPDKQAVRLTTSQIAGEQPIRRRVTSQTLV
ncbi:MAG: hypothetical protein KatS3mg057_1658 [Herpetosiphonaceae bacterium]|nr:MAG: hypothetical protein KatS3mg057_1658 [Herpetosiphonaceae bacterium]